MVGMECLSFVDGSGNILMTLKKVLQILTRQLRVEKKGKNLDYLFWLGAVATCDF